MGNKSQQLCNGIQESNVAFLWALLPLVPVVIMVLVQKSEKESNAKEQYRRSIESQSVREKSAEARVAEANARAAEAEAQLKELQLKQASGQKK